MQVVQRKRPVQKRSAATVEFVLDAAARILESEGLAGFNTNAVAARAGVSIGSLYQYFPGKEAITAALVAREHQRIAEGLRAMLRETDGMSVGYAISALMHMVIDFQSHAPKLHRVLELEEERLPRTAELDALEREIETLNRDFFRRYVDPARCSEAQLDNAARDTICIVRSMLDSAAMHGLLDAPDLHARLYRTIEGYLAPLLPQVEMRAVAADVAA
ncbi:TetR/AcrR family transcriptional regulator [Novosphingobium sp. BL-52-GroH]|uniref:TetR/AcrR family transcriptional regulator n=1 Tax=Novosphingobium sp. BL-52-GroH TaxID=3349877 RepID=UPI00384C123F